jgi:hypothetical protein
MNSSSSGNWNQPYRPIQPYVPTVTQPYTYPTTTYINLIPEYQMTDADINKVADRVIEKLKSEVLGMLLEADPKAVAQLLLKAVEKD